MAADRRGFTTGSEPFSFRVKSELASHPIPGHCCRRAELAALIKAAGSLVIGGNARLEIVAEHPGAARRAFTLARQGYNWPGRILTRRRSRLRKNRIYMVVIPFVDSVRAALVEMELVDNEGRPRPGTSTRLFQRRCCRKAYLRGHFLGGGSILSPRRGYHLSLQSGDSEQTQALREILLSFEISATPGAHRGRPVLYVKDGESVGRFLQVVGAHQAFLSFEERRVVRDRRNLANRMVNADTANLEKAITAGMRQSRAIERLSRAGVLSRMDLEWQGLARERVRHPELSLRELGALLDPPLSKSAVYSRMRRLEQLAGRVGDEDMRGSTD